MKMEGKKIVSFTQNYLGFFKSVFKIRKQKHKICIFIYTIKNINYIVICFFLLFSRLGQKILFHLKLFKKKKVIYITF